MKRSRLDRSSSFGDVSVINPPVASPPAFRSDPRANFVIITGLGLPHEFCEIGRRGIFTVSLPQVNVESGLGKVSHFLDRCFFCKKVLCQYDERFMYGDFRAFCSTECRNKQIAVDNEKQRF